MAAGRCAPGGGTAAGRVGAGGACCGRMTGRCGKGRAAGASPVTGSSMRSRRVGGTRRPGARTGAGAGGGWRRKCLHDRRDCRLGDVRRLDRRCGKCLLDVADREIVGPKLGRAGGRCRLDRRRFDVDDRCRRDRRGYRLVRDNVFGVVGHGGVARRFGAAAGRNALTSRGRMTGATGFGGSGALPPLSVGRLAAGVSANSGPCGNAIWRFLAWRSTNCRATISSIELDALLTPMPVSFWSRSMASWLERPSNSATL